MRALIVLLLLSSFASADRFTSYGVGSAVASNTAGIVSRVETRLDLFDRDDDQIGGILGTRLGVEWWRAGGDQGFALPLGFFAGANVNNVRTSLGGGLGLFTLVTSSNGYGIAPFASSLLELSAGKLVVAFDARVARQTLVGVSDFNVYSVMVSVGPRYR